MSTRVVLGFVAGALAVVMVTAGVQAANVRLGSDVFGSPVRPNSEFYVDFWFKTDSSTIGLVASDMVITYSGDLEFIDDVDTLLASQAGRNADTFIYDDFGTIASVKHDAGAQKVTLIGGVNLLNSLGEGQNGQKAPFARIAFRNIDGGGFTVRVAGNMGMYGEIVARHDWLGEIGDGPTNSVRFEVGDGGMGLP